MWLVPHLSLRLLCGLLPLHFQTTVLYTFISLICRYFSYSKCLCCANLNFVHTKFQLRVVIAFANITQGIVFAVTLNVWKVHCSGKWCCVISKYGDGRGTVVKVLCYKSKVAGSIPDGVIGIFHCHNPCDRTMALESTQPLTEMSTRRIFWG